VLVTGSCVGVLRSRCRELDTYCSGEGSHGWRQGLFHTDLGLPIPVPGDSTASKMDIRSVVFEVLADNAFESKFWDPGLAKWSEFMEFGRSQADFHWDPGSSDILLSIQFMRHSADFIPAHHHELNIAWPCFILFTQ
jgi:hypothetical protein